MTRFLFFACFALLSLTAHAGAQETVGLRHDIQQVEIYDKVYYLFDDSGALTLDQVRAHPEKFQLNTSKGLHFGEIGPVIWLRLDVANNGPREGEWLFATRRNFMTIFEAYLLRSGGAELLFTAADRKSVAASNKRHDMQAAAFVLAPGEKATLFVRYLGQNDSRLPASINSYESVAKVRQDKYIIFYVITASVIALVIYSSAIFLIIGGWTLLYYAAAEIALLLIVAQSNGVLSVHLWPEMTQLQKWAPGIVDALNVIFASLFTRNFFELKERAPRTDLFFRILSGAAILYLALTVILYQQTEWSGVHMLTGYFLLSLLWLYLPLLAAGATLRWNINYWPLIPGWGVVTVGHFYWMAVVVGLLPEPSFEPELVGFISVGQAFFLAVAIVLQVRQLRDEKLQTQLDLNSALQQQLQAATAQAEMLRELADQGRLVQAAGHDTRSILLGLRNFAAGLSLGAGPARVAQAANAITHLTDDLEAVLSTTLAGALGGAAGGGDGALAIETVSLDKLLAAVRLIHERPLRDKGLRFKVRANAHALVTDRALLARILGNLVDNAGHYTGRGGVILAARTHGENLRIQVWDSGYGITPDLLTRLLDAQAGQQRGTDASPGQGSGLQIAKLLARRIGGKISACSRPGRGSRFELVLPLALATAFPAGKRLWILDNDPVNGQNINAMAQAIALPAKLYPQRNFPHCWTGAGLQPLIWF